jgi:hypothetical protein
MSVKRYGSTEEEANATDSLKCRQIVKAITDFGINEQQKLKVIYLLALELENRDHLQDITALVKRCESGEHKKSTLITDVT